MERKLSEFMYGELYPIIKVDDTGNTNELYVESKVLEGICPECGELCMEVHDRHSRHIQDTPIHNKCTYINIVAREFKCNNPKCSTCTFTEEFPFACKNQQMTKYLKVFIVTLSIYLSSSCASLILSLLGVNISADSIDNYIKNLVIEDDQNVEEIGIDDVAIRKGMSYATAIYNLKTHSLIALLRGREKEDIKPWLKEHPKIKLVARDRASSYAKAVSEVYPNAKQVADRFHLFENIIKYIKDLLYSIINNKILIRNGQIAHQKVKKVVSELANIDENILKEMNFDNSKPLDENGKEIKFYAKQFDLNSEVAQKQKENRMTKYKNVKNIQKDYEVGMSPKDLATKYHYSTSTIKKYIGLSKDKIEELKEKKNYKTDKNNMTNYQNIIYKMLISNIDYEYIFAYVVSIGYSGSPMALRNYIRILASNNNLKTIDTGIYDKKSYKSTDIVIGRYDLLKYITTIDPKKIKDTTINENFSIITNKYPKIELCKNCFHDFHKIIFSKEPSELDIFIDKYLDLLPSFCNGLKKDIAAVKNAISTEINSGFVEGNNNKFKLIKRIVYGKQKICNLFKRCWLAFTSTLDDLSILMTVLNF